jgi:hypothetical protein
MPLLPSVFLFPKSITMWGFLRSENCTERNPPKTTVSSCSCQNPYNSGFFSIISLNCFAGPFKAHPSCYLYTNRCYFLKMIHKIIEFCYSSVLCCCFWWQNGWLLRIFIHISWTRALLGYRILVNSSLFPHKGWNAHFNCGFKLRFERRLAFQKTRVLDFPLKSSLIAILQKKFIIQSI